MEYFGINSNFIVDKLSGQLLYASTIIGFLIFIYIFYKLRKLILSNEENKLSIFLFCGFIFILFSLVLIGVGRFRWGIEYATTSRYMTPSLLLWTLTLILKATVIIDKRKFLMLKKEIYLIVFLL